MRDFNKQFAARLRERRKECGLTQSQVADKLGYSEKTVSKWENAAGLPSIECLAKLADVLRTDVNQLMRVNEDVYFLGIDGGGTKTAMQLCDENGTVLSELTLGASNPIDIGFEAAQTILINGIYKICEGIPLSSVYMFAGIAGIDSFQGKISKLFSGCGFANFSCGSDNRNIVSAGLAGKDGITVIMGTGVCIFRVLSGRYSQISGWGYLLDEGGSAFNFGREALSAYFSYLDGSGQNTLLVELIESRYQLKGNQLLAATYEQGKRFIASFAKDVFTAANSGDHVSKQILQRNLSVVCDKIEKAAEPFVSKNRKIDVILAGGLTVQPNLMESLNAQISRPGLFHFHILDVDPVCGAVSLAQRLYKNAI